MQLDENLKQEAEHATLLTTFKQITEGYEIADVGMVSRNVFAGINIIGSEISNYRSYLAKEEDSMLQEITFFCESAFLPMYIRLQWA
jgi:hypothetical protein